MQLFNEAFVLLTNYTLFCFTDFVPSPVGKSAIGWTLIAITCLNMAVNMGKMIGDNCIKAARYLKLRYLKHTAMKRYNEKRRKGFDQSLKLAQGRVQQLV